MNRLEQDRIFERNAYLRQKIGGTVFCLFVIAVWAWIMSYDVVCIWCFPVVLIMVLTGIWIITADRLIFEE